MRRGSASAEPEWRFIALDGVTEPCDDDLWFALRSFVGVPGEGVVVAGSGEFSAFFEVSVGLLEFLDFFLEELVFDDETFAVVWDLRFENFGLGFWG